MILNNQFIYPLALFCTTDFRDAKYQGYIKNDKKTGVMIKHGPGILWLDNNHTLISKWTNDEIGIQDSIIITANGGIMDVSGFQKTSLTYYDNHKGLLIKGDVESNKWKIMNLTQDKKGGMITLKYNNNRKIQIQTYQQIGCKQTVEESYDRQIVQKCKQILQIKPKQFGFIIQQNRKMVRKQKKTIYLISNQNPDHIRVQMSNRRINDNEDKAIYFPKFQFIEYKNSQGQIQLKYEIVTNKNSFSDEQTLKCQQIISPYKYQYNLIQGITVQNQKQKISNLAKYSQSYKKSYNVFRNSSNKNYYRTLINSSNQKIVKIDNNKKCKQNYHLKSNNFINKGHYQISIAIQTLSDLMNQIVTLFQQQQLQEWGGHKNKQLIFLQKSKQKHKQKQQQQQYYQFQVTQDDLKKQLEKIKRGQFSPRKNKPKLKQNYSNLNKTFIKQQQVESVTFREKEYGPFGTKNKRNLNQTIGEYFYIQQILHKDDAKIKNALSRIQEAKAQKKQIQRLKKYTGNTKSNTYMGSNNNIDRRNPQNLNHLTDNYYHIENQLKNEYHKKSIPMDFGKQKRKERVWQRNYNVAMEKMKKTRTT